MSIPGFGTPSVGSPPTTASQNYQYEAPEIQARKLGLMDIAGQLAQGKTGAYAGMQIPTQQMAAFDPQQPRAFDLATQGFGGYETQMNLASQYAAKAADPTSYQDFLNPYQQNVTAGIESQFDKMQNQAAAQAGLVGAFGGARQGVQTAELGRQRAEAVGQSLAQGYGQAQQAFDVDYKQKLQQMYAPYQRLGFVSDIYQGMPTSASSLTMATSPQANPMSQAIGMGITGLAAYQGYQNTKGD